ncbi:hypothetical protein GCM10023220_15960 [Streptomyces ziwulingensis]|uniref:EF-hand domain-containing protein n=2 Tax=Streptomyces ziwulingensis TaxID=1045501 RepID=A0ABP9B6D7_9ACTN
MGWWQHLSTAVDTDHDGRIGMDDLLAMVDRLPAMTAAVTRIGLIGPPAGATGPRSGSGRKVPRGTAHSPASGAHNRAHLGRVRPKCSR